MQRWSVARTVASPTTTSDGPLIISDRIDLLEGKNLTATGVKSLLLDAVFA